jgi:SEC-C motif domain protein
MGRKMPPKKPLPNKSSVSIEQKCPCGSELSLTHCCLPIIKGIHPATTAEALMRSRYSAHSLLAIDYLWQTWSPEQRLRSSKEDIYQWAVSCEWLGLDIIACHQGLAEDDQGTVEFIASFQKNNQLCQHHEKSLFKRILGQWIYVDHAD